MPMGGTSERLWAVALRLGRRAGVDVVRTGYASPVPDPASIDAELWSGPGEMAGVQLDLDAQLEFVNSDLRSFLEEFAELLEANEISGFRPDNRQYGRGDADVLFAMVRFARPTRVVEVGCGNSTHVTAAALRRNAVGGAKGRLVAVDPAPRIPLTGIPGADLEHLAIPLEETSLETFTSLDDGDILFIDSSHISKTGSDVNRLFLDILPRLSPGVWIHVHDIFLPWEYPRRLAETERKYWNEQYVLQALLCNNPSFDVELALHALWRSKGEQLSALVKTVRPQDSPGAFWMRRRRAT